MNKRFPLFVDLAGRKAVVVGGGNVGRRRAEILSRFGAEVTVIEPEAVCLLEGIRHVARRYREGDLAGAFLVVAAAGDGEVNAAVERDARRLGIWFNRADCQKNCDFFFPAVCEGDGVIIGIVGDGTNHKQTAQVARRIRESIKGET